MNNIRGVGVVEIVLAGVSGPNKTIDRRLAETAVITGETGEIGMSLLENLCGLFPVVLYSVYAVMDVRQIGIRKPLQGPHYEIPGYLRVGINRILGEGQTVASSSDIREILIDLSLRINGVCVIPYPLDPVLEMDVHLTLIEGLNGDEVERTDGLHLHRIDRKGKEPVVLIRQQACEEMVGLCAVLQGVAGKRRYVELLVAQEVIPPRQILGVSAIEGKHHELLGVRYGIPVLPWLADREEIIRVLVRRALALHEARRDILYLQMHLYILGLKTRLGAAGRGKDR